MTCQTCGHPHQENFCPNCGEKHHDPHHLTLRHFAEEILEGFTHVDHRFFRSVRALLFKPGLLTAEFVRGRRVPYMLPLPLFLVCNLLFFLFQTNNVFNQPLSSFTQYKPYTYFNTRQTAQRHLSISGETEAELVKRFNITMTTASKTYLFVLIPVFALLLALVFALKNRTYLEHLLFATHFYAFVLLFYLLQIVLILPFKLLSGQFNDSPLLDTITSLSSLLVFGFYLFLAFRRFYQTGQWASGAAAVLSSVTFVALVVGYRMLLFYKIMYTGH
ncbi:MAG: DUF3667 domain-containing protein [Sphingobacteriaceae bacterium]|nr:DUF3667 domain-containing protein [Cytophagaceae bacterium]